MKNTPFQTDLKGKKMKILQDMHIHSHHSCDSACSTLPDIRKDREEMGIAHFGVTDHLHTQYNMPDIVSSRRDFLCFNFPENYHFGIEITCMAAWECERIASGDFIAKGDVPIYGFRDDERPFDGRMCLDITLEDMRANGIEYVVGGIHWPQGFPSSRSEAIDNYFLQEMFLAEHPLVDILAHTWYSLEMASGDWYRNRDKEHIDWGVHLEIPEEIKTRLGETICKNGKLAELNIATLTSYSEEVAVSHMKMYALWKEMGVKFTIGSDQHSAHPNKEQFVKMENLLDRFGFTREDFALPAFRK